VATSLALLIAAEETVSRETLALITGGAAVFGSLIGGCVTGYFTLKGESKRQLFARETEQGQREHEDEKERAAARGAARDWRSMLKDSATLLTVCRQAQSWWGDEQALSFFPSIPERRLVASRMSGKEWDDLEHAETQLRRIEALRAVHTATGGSGLAWTADEGPDLDSSLEVVIADVEGGTKALDRHC
jgi:hypothetical protein